MELRIKVIIGISILSLLVLSFILILQSSLFDVEEFRVEGNENTPAEAIIVSSGIKKGDKLFPLDVDAASRSIERLPWVDTASVSTKWGGQVKFTITEREPVAVAFSRQGYVLLDATGRVLQIVGRSETCENYAQQYSGVICLANYIAPFIPGEHIHERDLPYLDIANHLHTLEKCLQPETAAGCPEGASTNLFSFVRQIIFNISDGRAASLQLRGGGWVLLGDPSNRLEVKLRGAFDVLTTDSAAMRELCGNATLNLKVPTRAVLTTDPDC